MIVTIGGKPTVLDAGQGVAKWLEQYQPLRHLDLFGVQESQRGGNRSGNYLDVGLACESWRSIPPLGVNELYWPTGASRFSVGMFLMRASDVHEIAEAPFQTPVPVTLYGLAGVWTTMYLGWRPITGTGIENDLYLVILVDERFWWQGKKVGDISVDTWDDLFSSLGTDLIGGSIETSEIHDDFQVPDKQEIERKHDLIPGLLDAACLSVGQRLVRGFDGTVKAQSFADAAEELEENLEDKKFLIAGNIRVPQAVPESVDVVFQGVINHIPCPHPYVVSVEANEEGSEDDEREVVSGVSVTIYSTCYADYTTNGTGGEPDNLETLEALANKIAESYYSRFDHSYDLTFQGVRPWVLSAYDDCILFRCGVEVDSSGDNDSRVSTTRVQSLPLTGHPRESLNQDESIKVLTGCNYIVEPVETIDPLDGDAPGSGETIVYEIAPSELLAETGVDDFIVFNLSGSALNVGEYYAAHVDEYCKAWVAPIGSSSLYSFTLTEDMGNTSSKQASCTIYTIDGDTVTEHETEQTVFDPWNVFVGGKSGKSGPCIKQGGKYYAANLGCSS